VRFYVGAAKLFVLWRDHNAVPAIKHLDLMIRIGPPVRMAVGTRVTAILTGGAIFSKRGLKSRTSTPRVAPRRAPPTIVFHGDHDTTVSAENGSEIVAQAVALGETQTSCLGKSVQVPANGRECTITTYRDSTMRPCIEQWVLHGAGHAWSGGCSNGSYTDERGPDASAEMVRFFLAQG
jgi:poly(3-hydroxybutyrate) depolymerase